MHRTDLDAYSVRLDMAKDRLCDFEEKAATVLGRSSVFIGTTVGCAIQKLCDEIQVVGLNLYSVESRVHCIPCCITKISYRLADVGFGHGPRRTRWVSAWR